MSDLKDRLSHLSPEERRLLELRLSERAGDGRQSIEKRGGEGYAFPLSFAQQRLWFLEQLEPGGAAYNMPAALRLSGALDVEALRRALREIVRRHEVLRTTFTVVDGQPMQLIHEPPELPLEVVEAGALAEEQVEEMLRGEALRPFDLAGGPLARFVLLRLSREEHLLLLTLHHIISDGWSMGVLAHELSALYAAYAGWEVSPLPELPVQYADYALWQREWLRGEVLERELEYWRRTLADLPPPLELPADRPRPAVPGNAGALERFELPRELSESLKALSRQEGMTLFMTLLAAFQALLSRYTDREDILVGTAIANRARTEVEPLIGFFVNTLVLRTDLSGDPSFRELLRRVRAATLGAYAHQEVPFERLVEELQPERELGRAPFSQVMFNLQNDPAAELDLPGLKVTRLPLVTGLTNSDLTLNMTEATGALKGEFEYSTELFDAETIRRMVGVRRAVLPQDLWQRRFLHGGVPVRQARR
ncbi:MAG TPA: condensation domain-containing protein, partial [Pyrinomonadaceae bacterium]|nr:condensation domain-containing protein [Pyrinomonadaceae bacterium]